MIFDILDKTLLDFFERFSHWFQEMFGKDNFWLARVFSWFFCFLCFYTWLVPIQNFPQIPIIDSLMFFLMRWKIREGESSVSYSGDNPSKNKMAISSWEQGSRLRWLIFFIVISILSIRSYALNNFETSSLLMAIVNIAKFICIVCIFYLAACTPKPPSKNKVRKFVEGIGKKIRTLIPSHEPVPVPA